MKKISLLALLFAFSLSCSDQYNSIDHKAKDNKISIDEAKQHFSTESVVQKMEQPNVQEKPDRKSLSKNADWTRAFYQDLSFGSALIVPVKFDQEIFYRPNQDISLPISALTYLLFYKNDKKETHMEVITSVPSFDKNDTTQNQIFKGTIWVENWNGEFIKGFIFKNGKEYKMTGPSKQSWKSAYMMTICTTTDWYSCVSVGGGAPYCNYNYSETTCSQINSDGSGGGGSTGSTGGDGTGSTIGDGTSTSTDYAHVAAYTYPYVVDGGQHGTAIPNLQEYLKCFDATKDAKVTIFVDQPFANSEVAFRYTDKATDPVDVGHTWFSVTQVINGNTVTRLIGFYPKGVLVGTSVKTSGPGQIKDDSGRAYDVSLSMDLSQSQTQALLSFLAGPTGAYDLNKFNCTGYVVFAFSLLEINLPATVGTWPGGKGLNPGNFGQDLRGYTGSCTSKKTDGGTSQSVQGVCSSDVSGSPSVE